MSTILDKSEPDYRSVKVKNKSQNNGNTAAGAHDSEEFHLKCFMRGSPLAILQSAFQGPFGS